ncbi:Fic family protein [Candidatus Protofrankia californiensis]|uniref:Fic family protein n=1 Tax=Candidatus Protofrankia californiensis TaxID=1839754 RepID=UPI0010418366|nr:Fic family protein [Candidatus Protofrankia californiensis]
MGRYGEQLWSPDPAAPLRGRRVGVYRPYCPDLLASYPPVLQEDLVSRAMAIEAGIRSLSATAAVGLDRVAGFLLRSEAIGSSRMEGIRVAPQQVALAEFAVGAGPDTVVEGFSTGARRVARNITALRQAVTDVARAGTITVDGIVSLQRTLLPGHRSTGPRTVQTWLGGSEWNPLDAAFIPPPASAVGRLMADLATYASEGPHPPLIQAGLVHAQFETIQPFDDGNGRVGRTLIHTVLARRGLLGRAVLPVSLVFMTRPREYVRALTAFCHEGPPNSMVARTALNQWLTFFLDAVVVAVEEARTFTAELAELRRSWDVRLSAFRNRTTAPRNRPWEPSVSDRLLAALSESPVITEVSAARLLDVPPQAAWAAAEELVAAGILRRRQIGRGTIGYLSREVSDLLSSAERRLTSVK